jgi:hypothetical protein
LSIGERDRRLLALHEVLFGPTLNSYAECPQCSAELEFQVDARGLLAAVTPGKTTGLELAIEDLRVRFRLPTTVDLEAISETHDVSSARRRLAERCIVETVSVEAGAPSSPGGTTVDRIADAIALAEADADAVVHVHCAECHQTWAVVVDIGSFLWTEVNALVKSLLHQVHTLAWAYGWREADVLGMTSVRRAFYLGMVTE